MKKIFFLLFMVCLLPTVSDAADAIPPGSLIKFQSDPRIYVIADSSGDLSWIQTEAEFLKRGYSFSDVHTEPDAALSEYKIGKPLSPTAPMIFVVEDGKVVSDVSSNVQWPAASISKLLSALVFQDMHLDWNGVVTMTRADEVGGARLRVNVGLKYRRIDLLHASLMGSANNATYALARTAGVSMSEFVHRMNAKAAELGMTQSHFVGSTGLDSRNVSTAHDIALLVAAAHADPLIAEIELKPSYTLQSVGKNPRTHTIKSTNKLLLAGKPVMLGKTGYLIESRYNFCVMSVGTNGAARTTVVLGAPTDAQAFQLADKFVSLN